METVNLYVQQQQTKKNVLHVGPLGRFSLEHIRTSQTKRPDFFLQSQLKNAIESPTSLMSLSACPSQRLSSQKI